MSDNYIRQKQRQQLARDIAWHERSALVRLFFLKKTRPLESASMVFLHFYSPVPNVGMGIFRPELELS
jgi:hypothetical protein